MLTNIKCRIPVCATLLTVNRYYPRSLNSHGKPFLLLSNPVPQKINITSTQLHARVPVLKNFQNTPPASTLPEFFPKNLQNKTAAKTTVEKLKRCANPKNYDDENITVSPNHFRKALGVRRVTWTRNFKKYPQLGLLTRDALADRISVLKQHGISQDRIEIAPWLLLRPFEELEALAYDIARILNVPFRCAIPLTNIPIEFLKRMAIKWRKEVNELEEFKDGKFRNRMEYLADRLKLSTEDIAYMISRCVRISHHPLCFMKPVIQILEDAGVRSDDIYRNPYNLLIHAGSSGILRRLKIIKEYEIQHVKPWMFFPRECVLRELVRKRRRELDLLSGHSSVRSFLQTESNRTSCNVDIAPKFVNEMKLRYLGLVEKVERLSAVRLAHLICHFLAISLLVILIIELARISITIKKQSQLQIQLSNNITNQNFSCQQQNYYNCNLIEVAKCPIESVQKPTATKTFDNKTIQSSQVLQP